MQFVTDRQPQSTRPTHRSRTARRIALGLLAALLTLILAGASYQALAEAADRRAFPPPGRLVDVGGHRLHIHCLGQGQPTVVLEGGMFASSAMWSWVQPELARHTRVCAYDRAGMGWSEAGPHSPTAAQIAAELFTLLQTAEEPGPYIVVGHSLGAAPARVFATAHPAQVAGLVLVDATHPDLLARLPAELAAGFTPDELQLGLIRALARLGVARGLNLLVPDLRELPQASQAVVAALNLSTRSLDAITAELRAIPLSLEQARTAGSLGTRPLLVLSAETTYASDPAAQAIWDQLQQDLTTLSTQTLRHVIPGTTHESLVYSQAGAQATAGAILDLVEAIRTRRPLH